MSDQSNALLDRLTSVLDVFDLSFIISGGSGIAAILCSLYSHGYLNAADLEPVWLVAIGLLLVTYVLGLLCFTVGRSLRQSGWVVRRPESMESLLCGELSNFGVTLDSFVPGLASPAATMTRRDGSEPLYNLCWARIRHSESSKGSLRLLTRYWVLAATCDGIAASLILWYATVLCLIFTGPQISPVWQIVFSVSGLLATRKLIALLFRESIRCKINQIREIASTIAILQTVEKR
jgi:hypothetical protein